MAEPAGTPVNGEAGAQAPNSNGTMPSTQEHVPSFSYQPPAQGLPKAELDAALKAQQQEYEAKIAELNAKAVEAQKLQERLDAIEAEKLAEQGKFKELYEKEQAERKRETQAMRRELARAELKTLAVREGIIDPDLIDLIPAKSFKWDEETQRYTNLADLINEHKQLKPAFYKKGGAPAQMNVGSGEPPPVPTAPAQKDVRSMSRSEYEAYKKSYIRQLAGHR